MEPVWGRQTFQYKAEETALPLEPKAPVDTLGPALARLQAELAALKQELDALKQRKSAQTTIINQGEKGAAKQAHVPRATPAPLLFVAHDISKEAPPPAHKPPEYVLQPGTWLPCHVEPEMHSEVEGHFTAKVSQNVYDTATRRHLLVPQGSTILANDQSSELVYGNERMDTISLTLVPSGGTSVDLGKAPVTDERGVIGLTGDVDQHYWRLFGAVFIGGALKGGMQAMQTALLPGAGAGQVASGMATYGNQATSRVVGRALDTRPTIKVHAGQVCNVLLIKTLQLPALWQ
jgi:type IV secretion system protein VirB10